MTRMVESSFRRQFRKLHWSGLDAHAAAIPFQDGIRIPNQSVRGMESINNLCAASLVAPAGVARSRIFRSTTITMSLSL